VKLPFFLPCGRNSDEVGFLVEGRLARDVKNPPDGNFSRNRFPRVFGKISEAFRKEFLQTTSQLKLDVCVQFINQLNRTIELQ
jgi:hypothetical protein